MNETNYNKGCSAKVLNKFLAYVTPINQYISVALHSAEHRSEDKKQYTTIFVDYLI